MATLALGIAGAALGSALLPGGIGLLGTTISGAVIGRAAGALAGSLIDQALLGGSGQTSTREGPRLSDLHVMASTEGAPIPRLYGRARLGGQMIWATNLEEVRSEEEQGGGKGLGGAQATTVEYRYFANFAVALCEGEISRLGRIWADGKELDLGDYTYRLYKGSETQLPDSLVEAKEGVGNAPSYRGVAYVVFERMALAKFGNRIPQLSFEVWRAVDDLETRIRGVTLIPGAGEFALSTSEIKRVEIAGSYTSENVNTRHGRADLKVALDDLEDTLPNAKSIGLVVAWFGDDLRCGDCKIAPRVEIAAKETSPETWSVAGLTRAGARTVSLHAGRPAYGGTPSDNSVIEAIAEARARGLAITYYPFVLMDIAEGNGLPDPHGGAGQAAYPWRGRITCNPAPMQPGSPDKTAAAGTQVAAFVGSAARTDFTLLGSRVIYSGPAEWSYRRFVLHNAWLAKAAGGVDAFLLGTELKGLTQVRDSAAHYPFVDALIALAADVKAILGPATKVSYAADWSEYFGHQPADGTGDVYFNLDALWASPAVDAVGIDVYWPLADWRDGTSHADYAAGWRTDRDSEYLRSNLQGGEGYDFYYASDAARDAQTRTPISDGAGKPWMFRFKDIKGWWSNPHFHRSAGAELSSPTAWMPRAKPIWFTEIGCPAIDKGANRPNVFVDAKSTESALPYYSRATRDDDIQRRYLRAFLEGFDPLHPAYVGDCNPVSDVYAGRMVDLDRVHVYTWDARPFPAFPLRETVWGDAANWQLGHWIGGRMGQASLSGTIETLLADFGFEGGEAGSLSASLDGYVVDRIMSARDALQPLELGYFFDARESGGRIVFEHRGRAGVALSATAGDCVERKKGLPPIEVTRAQESELPRTVKLGFIDAANDYMQGEAEARRSVGQSARVATAQLPLVTGYGTARAIAETWLIETWAARERASVTLPPSRLAIEPGDMIELADANRSWSLRVTEAGVGAAVEIEARSIEPGIYQAFRAPGRGGLAGSSAAVGPPEIALMDLPLLRGDESPTAGRIAGFHAPWPGGINVFKSEGGESFLLATTLRSAATMGRLLAPLASARSSVWDRSQSISVEVLAGSLASLPEIDVLGGRNAAAIETPSGNWEVLQFQHADLLAPRTYRLSTLLRAQAGTDEAMLEGASSGARFVLLDRAVGEMSLSRDEVGRPLSLRIGPASRAISDASYIETIRAFQGAGLRPFAPAHVRGRRLQSGDLEITWVRRTRVGGDAWEQSETPLGEDQELYEIDILAGGAVRRTLRSVTSSLTYAATAQIEDFGSIQPTVSLKAYQLSPSYGRGSPARATL